MSHGNEAIPSCPEVGALLAGAAVGVAWRVHLARRQPRRAAAVVLIVAAAAVLAYLVFGHPLPAALTLLALLTAVSEFLFPTLCRLDHRGATKRNVMTVRSIPWSAVRRVLVDADGISLSPLPTAARRHAYRVLHLPLPNDGETRAVVCEMVRQFAPPAALPEGWRDTG
ncbi:MAG: hypothetical protein QHJ73_00885 [Armatimonadota bacterium]|nr:hypothetical protein [Armatimonadota bacterium]